MAGVTFGDVFGCEGEVVETGFGGDVYAGGAGGAEEGDGFDGGEMDYVEVEGGSEVRMRENFIDGVGFKGGRTGR